MTKRCVPQVVTKGNCLNEIFIEPQQTPDGSTDLRDQLHMENAVGNMIVLNEVKYLGLVDVSGIG